MTEPVNPFTVHGNTAFIQHDAYRVDNIPVITNAFEIDNAIILEASGKEYTFRRSQNTRKDAVFQFFRLLKEGTHSSILLHKVNALGVMVTRELDINPQPTDYRDDRCAFYFGSPEGMEKMIMDMVMENLIPDIDVFKKENCFTINDKTVAFFAELTPKKE